MAAYVGPAAPLSTLLYDPARSLHVQSYDPREQLGARVNCDGTGVAWWVEGEAEPLRYAVDRPPWQDANLPRLARRLRGHMQLAAVRSATPGIPQGVVNVAPFVRGRFAAAHNGHIGAFRQLTARPLLERLPDHLHASLDGISDSQVLFLTALRHLEADPDGGLLDAASAAVAEVASLCARHDTTARLNLLLADGDTVVGARLAQASPANSLYTLTDGKHWPGACLIASEPLDDDAGWTAVPEGCAVALTLDGPRQKGIAELASVS